MLRPVTPSDIKAPALPPDLADQVIARFRQDISSGAPWYPALLNAIRSWELAEETHQGRHYRYLVGGQALDWLLVAERLCQAVDDLLPPEEKEALLLHGRPPLKLSTAEFKELLGDARYGQYLNYYYGIAVEEALFLAVQEEVRKERRTQGLGREQDAADEAFGRIYGAARPQLFRTFRRETGRPHGPTTDLAELREFTYWLFKHRLATSDKARVASDTKKGLRALESISPE